MNTLVGNFFIPRRFDNKLFKRSKMVAIIPSYKPSKLTLRLVRDILRWNKDVFVYVVDDSTPIECEYEHDIFKQIEETSNLVKVIRTPKNRLKAGAINYALIKVLNKEKNNPPKTVLVFDDDVVISKNTISSLVNNLFQDDKIGAVCSQCRVSNKNKNFLTRLQGLEYLGFNGTRLADEGFFGGPLVMHGMLSAFRTDALQDVGLFAEKHLIEDYEITARIKHMGWYVRLAPFSYAWTNVPEKFSDLWRQRARWTVGGLFVVGGCKSWKPVIQDLIGHTLFLFTLLFIVLSFIFYGNVGPLNSTVPLIIIFASFLQVALWYAFQLWFMQFYSEKDWKDWLIRLALIPEFVYANVLTLCLLGSYTFYFFQIVSSRVSKNNRVLRKIKNIFEKIYFQLGYSVTWGTRGHKFDN